jgi:hypothetical protein
MIATLLALALAAPAPAAAAPKVTDVVAERGSFRPEEGESAAWRYRTAVASEVTVSIYDARDVLVRTLVKKEDLPAGDHRLAWDGRDDSGRRAPPGYYLLVIESVAGGETARYDPSETTGGDLTQASAVRFDRAAGLVRYAITRPALLRIHLGLKNDGPLLRTLADWVAKGAGEHTEPWDGWDASGVIRFGDSPDLDVQIWAYALPVNAVVVEPAKPAASGPPGTRPAAQRTAPPAGPSGPARLDFLEFRDGRPRRTRGEAPVHEMYNHWRHDRERCHNPAAVLKVPGGPAGDGRPVPVSAPVPIRLELPADEAASVQEERFETVIYVDGVFAFEEEQGYLPFTWILKPEMLTPGEHVITFMVRGYEGHFGSSSIRVLRPKGAGTPASGR